jgi:hypothetical protein
MSSSFEKMLAMWAGAAAAFAVFGAILIIGAATA